MENNVDIRNDILETTPNINPTSPKVCNLIKLVNDYYKLIKRNLFH